MAKTKRMIRECLPEVDIVIELLDSRIPYSSKNPEIDTLVGEKAKLTVFTKASLADPDITREWVQYYQNAGKKTVVIDSVSGLGIDALAAAVREMLHSKLERYKEKGMAGRKLKAMIVGIPNVGKSSLINRIAGGKKAKVEDRPGVTVTKQWVPTNMGFDLLDMPGVLWPKFEEKRVGENLAITGAIRDKILDTEEIAMICCQRLFSDAREQFLQRYKLTYEECEGLDGYDLFELVGKKRGFLIRGGETDHARTADIVLDEFRGGKVGRISLERP